MRLLLVEDDSTYATIERRALEQSGAHCGEVHTAEEAVAWLGKHDVDAVILDLSLHDTEGLDTVQTVAAATAAPIVVVTGTPDAYDRRALLLAGADDVLDKRDNVHLQLLEHIRDAIARDQGRAQRQTDPLRS